MKNKIKARAGRLGGSITSRAKRLAAKKNGVKGGRPKGLGKIPDGELGK